MISVPGRLGRRLAEQATFFSMLGAQVASAGGAFVLNVLVARSLGPAPRGEIGLLLQVAYFVTVFAGLGRPEAILVGARRDDPPGGLARSLLPGAILVAFALSIPIALIQFPSLGVLTVVVAAFAQICGGLISNLLRSTAIVSGHPKRFVFLVLANQLVLISGGVAIIALNRGVLEWAWLYALGSLLPAVIALGVQVVDASPLAGKRSYELRGLGLRLLPGYGIQHVSGKVERLLMPALGGYASLGVYSVAATFVDVAGWPVKHYIDSKVNGWGESSEKGSFSVRRVAAPIILALAGASVCAAAASYVLIAPIFGDAYIGSMRLVLPLCLALFVRSSAMLFMSISAANGRPAAGAAVHAVSAAVTVILCCLLVPTWGAEGAAWAVVGGGAAGLLVGGWRVCRFEK